MTYPVSLLQVWMIFIHVATYGNGIFTQNSGRISKRNWIQAPCIVTLVANCHHRWLFLEAKETAKVRTIYGNSISVSPEFASDLLEIFCNFPCFPDVESWEKISIAGLKPRPRSESRAFIVSELLLQGASKMSLEAKSVRIRARTCKSADRGNRHSSYLPNNRVAPCEKTYIFEPTQVNYNDGKWSFIFCCIVILFNEIIVHMQAAIWLSNTPNPTDLPKAASCRKFQNFPK